MGQSWLSENTELLRAVRVGGELRKKVRRGQRFSKNSSCSEVGQSQHGRGPHLLSALTG